jgi:hypothetical protein
MALQDTGADPINAIFIGFLTEEEGPGLRSFLRFGGSTWVSSSTCPMDHQAISFPLIQSYILRKLFPACEDKQMEALNSSGRGKFPGKTRGSSCTLRVTDFSRWCRFQSGVEVWICFSFLEFWPIAEIGTKS